MKQILLEQAKKLIDDFFIREYGVGAEKEDFEDLSKIFLAYNTTEDRLTDIFVIGDLMNFRIDTYLGEFLFRRIQSDSLQDMVDNVLPSLNFEKMTFISNEECRDMDARLMEAFNRSLENNQCSFSIFDVLGK